MSIRPPAPGGGGSGGSSPVPWMKATATLSAADAAAAATLDLTIDGDLSGWMPGWTVSVDGKTLLPPEPGVYVAVLAAEVIPTPDAPIRAEVWDNAGNTFAAVDAPVTFGRTTAPSHPIPIDGDVVTGLQIKGAYSNDAPTTGALALTLSVHRIGDYPA